MSQQEDDLRALAKIMDFLRAVSIILVVMNVYWFCYEAIRLWGVSIGLLDRFSSGTQSHGNFIADHVIIGRPGYQSRMRTARKD